MEKNIIEVEYNREIISFEVIYRKRRTVEIRIEPPNRIVVISPMGVTSDKIKQVVKGKGKWIMNKLSSLVDYKVAAITNNLKNDDELLLLGRKYKLKILENNLKKSNVYVQDRYVIIETNSNEKIGDLIKSWYKEKALDIIKERIYLYENMFDIKHRSVKIRDQKTRWGSCTYKNDLLFNFRCIMLTLNQLDYIVVHEMCHMIEKNHAKSFWSLVESCMPSYEIYKEELKGIRIG